MDNYYFAWMGGKNLIVKDCPSFPLAKQAAEEWSGANSLNCANMVAARKAEETDFAIKTIIFHNQKTRKLSTC